MEKRNKMILTKLEGGLGNQMFQYAIASILAKKKNTSILIDTNFFNQTEKSQAFTPRNFELSIFNNSYIQASESEIGHFQQLSFFDKIKKKLGFNYPKIYTEATFDFDEKALSVHLPVYLKGYFQSFKYLKGYENLIKNIFAFPIDKLDSVNEKLLLTIKQTNSISIHIRRGDYVNDKKTQGFHGNCSLEYYKEAIALLASKTNDISLFFFSDDTDWVKEQFDNLSYPKVFVANNTGENSWKDMCLMSFCRHNIIANSSFSWWAAWLNEHSDKIVVAPKKWFVDAQINTNDLIPNEWIRL